MRTVLRWVQPILVAAAIVSIVYILAGQWQELRAYPWSLNPLWLGVSALLMVASWAVEIQLWRSLLRTLGGLLAYLTAARIWFLSAIVRYIPGNIWQPLSMTLYGQQQGLRPEITLTSVLLYQVIILLAAAPMASLYFAVTGNWGLLGSVVGGASSTIVALVVLPVIVFVAFPNLLVLALNWLLRRVGRQPLEAGLSRRRLLWSLLVAAFDWLLWGGAFAALVFGIADYSPAEMAALAPHLIVTYAIAYCVGFLSLITPSGFGVREGTLYLLLGTLLPGSVITVSALAMRAWTILGEVTMAILAALTPARVQPTVPALSTPLEQEPGA